MADVFLSYKREDRARVRKLVNALRQLGLDVWWDEDIPPSAPWEATIEKALSDAKAVIVCWSPTSVASDNVRSEARVAREDGRLLQVFVKPSTPPLFFGERQGVDLSKWNGRADDPRIVRLAETVRKVGAGEAIEGSETPGIRRRVDARVRALAIIAFAVLLLAGAAMIVWRGTMADATPEVAVLPFEDLSQTHDKAYFAEGVAEEILSSLSADKAIKVLGRTSALAIDKNADPKALRRSLGITHILEGSARTAGNALRVDVRLIDTKDGMTVWQDQYRGRVSDVFSVQDQIAKAVVTRLQGMVAAASPVGDRPQTSADAYDMYLAARTLMRTRSEPTLQKALALARRVVDAQPGYAPGQALYAELIMHLSDDPLEYGHIPIAQARPIARAHALRAIQLAPTAPDGYGALGLISQGADAIPPLKRAIALDPSRADYRIWLEEAYERIANYDGAFKEAEKAAEIEPLWAVAVNRLVLILAASRRFDEALNAVRHFEQIGGDRAQALRFRAGIARRRGDYAQSIFYLQQALKLDKTLPYARGQLAGGYYILGLADRARAALPADDEVARLLIDGQRQLIVERSRSGGRDLFDAPELDVVIFALGAERAWGPLGRLYDESGMDPPAFCAKLRGMSFPMVTCLPVVQALAAAGEAEKADALLKAVTQVLDHTFVQSYRWAEDPTAEAEAERAMVLALSANKDGAIDWLNRAINLGWIGYPYSPRLVDWPQLDGLRGDPRLAALQAKIDRAIAQQRAQVLANHI